MRTLASLYAGNCTKRPNLYVNLRLLLVLLRLMSCISLRTLFKNEVSLKFEASMHFLPDNELFSHFVESLQI